MQLTKIAYAVTAIISASVLSGCNSDDNNSHTPLQFSFGMENTSAVANDQNIPIPNDLYFFDKDGSKQNNIVIMGCGNTDSGVETAVENATKCSLEDLNGWSTTAPFSLPISGDLSQLDSSHFPQSIFLTANGQRLIYDEDFTVRATTFGHLQILPLKVMQPETLYQLTITDLLTDKQGYPVEPSPAYEALKQQNNTLGHHILKAEAAAAVDLHISPNAIVYTAQFTTQSIGGGLLALQADSNLAINFDTSVTKKYKTNNFIPVSPLKPTTCDDGNCVEKLAGVVNLPDYLPSAAAISQNCKADIANMEEAKFWYTFYGANTVFDNFLYTKESCPELYKPIDFSTTTTTPVEVSLVIPTLKEGATRQLLDSFIFAHGITGVKGLGNGEMLIFDNFVQPNVAHSATRSGSDGYAAIAIDHVYHGTRSLSFDGSAGYDCDADGKADSNCFSSTKGSELLPDAYDFSVSSSLRALKPKLYGAADAKNFLKADALLTSRDNFQKVVADFMNLKMALHNSVDANGRVTFSDNVSIYGHSMGAIAAATLAGLEVMKGRPFAATILANGGGGVGGIIMNSTWLGKDEVPPAVKFSAEYRLRMAKELGIQGANEAETLTAVHQYAVDKPKAFMAKSNEIAPQYLAEMQYLVQAVIDTVDPLNYAAVQKEEIILSFESTGNIDTHPDLIDYKDANFTPADQTVPIKVELDGNTMFTRCKLTAEGKHEAVPTESGIAGCSNGSEQAPYYSLNVTEFPLSGAAPLDEALGLVDVRDGTQRSVTKMAAGGHNIGVGGMTETRSEGYNNQALATKATTEVQKQTVDFLSDEFGVVKTPDTALLMTK